MPGITKLDVIGLVQKTRFTDFSVIYEFKWKSEVLNPEPIEVESSLEESVAEFLAEGNYFKVLKRLFAIAKYKDDTKAADLLTNVLNSDLGRLYHIVSDIGTLRTLIEEHSKVPDSIVRYEISELKARLGNIYTLTGFLKRENGVLRRIQLLLKKPLREMGSGLERLQDVLYSILQKYSKPIVERFRNG
jgi:hypothetical protein